MMTNILKKYYRNIRKNHSITSMIELLSGNNGAGQQPKNLTINIAVTVVFNGILQKSSI